MTGSEGGGEPVPPAVPWAQLHETHSGVVLLLGDRALKFKKPVDLGFLDFTTLEKRRAVCVREVELNSRLAEDVYLGVADLVGPSGEPLEPVVLMRRMPEDRRLSTLVAAGEDVLPLVRAVARELAAFHSGAERSEAISRDVSVESLAALWETSFVQMRAFGTVPASLEADVERLVGRYLAGRGTLFEHRAVAGAVLDGHGDLMAEDIFCLPDRPRILDCLEFDDRLRHVDRIDDAAFLAMDLEHLGAVSAAVRFMDWYAEFSGDNAPVSLVEHYVAYRAFVRAKVACVRHGQGDGAAAFEARQLTEMAQRHLRRGAVKLLVVGGSPGTGKSTIAAGVADRLGMVLLASDRVRKELADLPPMASAADDLDAGIYTPRRTHRVYEELISRATALLAMGESVVVDATWATGEHRQLARDVADACAADLVEVRCEVPPDVADARIRERPRVSPAGTASDATPEVVADLRDRFDPWPEAHALDTSADIAESLAAAGSLVRSADPPLDHRS